LVAPVAFVFAVFDALTFVVGAFVTGALAQPARLSVIRKVSAAAVAAIAR
jgi:hypothetical protein